MLHFYDESPSESYTIHARLLPARILLSSGIPFAVWGEDALSFVHFVPTALYEFLILVPDELVQAAANHLLKECPEYSVTNKRPQKFVGPPGCRHNLPSAIPNSIQLEWVDPPYQDIPAKVLIIGQSQLCFDVRDSTRRTRGLIPPFEEGDARIRFPTQAAFLDALIDWVFGNIMKPDSSHPWCYAKHTMRYLSYLVTYNVRHDSDEDPLDPARTLLPTEQEMLRGISPRNRTYLEAYMRKALPEPTPEMIDEWKRLRASESQL